jgi:predicted nucleic acid-binding protein
MIILDTNVISEIMRERPDPLVVQWVDNQTQDPLWTTSISLAELLTGIYRLPDGRKRTRLENSVSFVVDALFQDRILPFDESAARAYALIVTQRFSGGRPIDLHDAQIAAIARSRGATLATRNIKDFAEDGVALVNPWEFKASPPVS